MKIKNILITAFSLLFVFVAALGCAPQDGTNNEITLTLDKTTAYFSSETELYPVSGALPLAGDPCEVKTVKLGASEDVKMRLVITTEAQVPTGLMVSVNGGIAKQIENGAVIYESAQKEKEAQLTLTVFVAHDADKSAAGKSVSFALELKYEAGEQ